MDALMKITDGLYTIEMTWVLHNFPVYKQTYMTLLHVRDVLHVDISTCLKSDLRDDKVGAQKTMRWAG